MGMQVCGTRKPSFRWPPSICSPGVAQKLMRHSDIRLTMNTYTHPGLADTAGAVAALPAF